VTDFLYPFIERNERDGAALLDDLARSAEAKMAMSVQLRESTLVALDADLRAAAGAIAQRFAGGGRLFAFGNGGSATDAAGVAALFGQPPS
jgi:D-sedoheptulose 7-phosphate isomerase